MRAPHKCHDGQATALQANLLEDARRAYQTIE